MHKKTQNSPPMKNPSKKKANEPPDLKEKGIIVKPIKYVANNFTPYDVDTYAKYQRKLY